ncbi:MAG: hypothetical protein WB558_23290 [Terriglobales bacterium]
MNKKTASMLVSLMICLIPLFAYAQGSCNCAECQTIVDHGIRIYTCGATAQSPGGCACLIVQGISCFPCGCCSWNPQTGALCYDETGDLCGQMPCMKGTIMTGITPAQEPTLPSGQMSQKELIESSPWLTDVDFQQKIDALSHDLGFLVKNYQTIFRDEWKKVPFKERRAISGKMILGNISYKLAVTKTGSDWRLELSPDPDDPDSHQFGSGVPNVLEILGRNWRVIHHVHHVDKTDNVIASGAY